MKQPKEIFVKKGLTLNDISFLLKNHKIIESKITFKVFSKFLISDKALKAGEYKFGTGIPLSKVFSKLEKGNTFSRKILIPEGFTVKQTINILLENKYINGNIKSLPKEGNLFPDTYFYERGEDINKVISKMSLAMKDNVDKLWKNNRGIFKNKKELIIFASIIEAEARKDEEKKIISAVFHNRIKLNMRLQSDPTVLYYKNLISKNKISKIYRSDLTNNNPWNTYTNRGLPVTAINNPGIGSLEAALNPSPDKYLYFVSDGKGGHRFSNTLDEHNKNVYRWKKEVGRK